MSPERLRGLVQELVDENPFAIRAVLRICEIRFSDQVPTLAVTCEDRPALLVNLDFVKKQCRNDDEVKAVLCHEFLHVLLRHTEQVGAITPAKHLAFDAVINAIIHRSFGVTWSALMSHYYARVGDLRKLLRPMNKQEQAAWDAKRYKKGNDALPGWVHAWASLYEGRMVADDIAETRQLFGGQQALPLLLRIRLNAARRVMAVRHHTPPRGNGEKVAGKGQAPVRIGWELRAPAVHFGDIRLGHIADPLRSKDGFDVQTEVPAVLCHAARLLARLAVLGSVSFEELLDRRLPLDRLPFLQGVDGRNRMADQRKKPACLSPGGFRRPRRSMAPDGVKALHALEPILNDVESVEPLPAHPETPDRLTPTIPNLFAGPELLNRPNGDAFACHEPLRQGMMTTGQIATN
jgi:hypothetical protein